MGQGQLAHGCCMLEGRHATPCTALAAGNTRAALPGGGLGKPASFLLPLHGWPMSQQGSKSSSGTNISHAWSAGSNSSSRLHCPPAHPPSHMPTSDVFHRCWICLAKPSAGPLRPILITSLRASPSRRNCLSRSGGRLSRALLLLLPPLLLVAAGSAGCCDTSNWSCAAAGRGATVGRRAPARRAAGVMAERAAGQRSRTAMTHTLAAIVITKMEPTNTRAEPGTGVPAEQPAASVLALLE